MSELRLDGQTVFIPVGLPCCGKSTMFKALASLEGVGENLALVSPDCIREELYPGYEAGAVPFDKIDNSDVFDRSHALLHRFVVDGYDVWFDALNLRSVSRHAIRSEVQMAELDPAFSGEPIEFVVIDMEVPLVEILSRNEACRVAHRRPPEDRLRTMAESRSTDPLKESDERTSVWHLVWDRVWVPAAGFVPGPVCSAMMDAANGG